MTLGRAINLCIIALFVGPLWLVCIVVLPCAFYKHVTTGQFESTEEEKQKKKSYYEGL